MTDIGITQFIERFCPVDDFCLKFEPEFNKRFRDRKGSLHNDHTTCGVIASYLHSIEIYATRD